MLDMRVILSIVTAAIIVGGLVALGHGLAGRGRPVVQPIAFNHSIHVNQADMECMACHTDAAIDVYAGLPGKDICLDCHDIDEEQEDAHPEKAKLFAFVDSEGDIPWQRVALTKPDVFFSHRRHVSSAGLDCLECHPRQPTRTTPPSTAELVMSMDRCIECHEATGADTDCLACHR